MFGWSILKSFFSGRILHLFAALLVALCVYAIWNAGRDSEKAKVVKAVEKSVRVSNAIQDKNRKSSDADIDKRLLRWTVSCN